MNGVIAQGVIIVLYFIIIELVLRKLKGRREQVKDRKKKEEIGKDAGMSWDEYNRNRGLS